MNNWQNNTNWPMWNVGAGGIPINNGQSQNTMVGKYRSVFGVMPIHTIPHTGFGLDYSQTNLIHVILNKPTIYLLYLLIAQQYGQMSTAHLMNPMASPQGISNNIMGDSNWTSSSSWPLPEGK